MKITIVCLLTYCFLSCKTFYRKEYFRDTYLIYTKENKTDDDSFYDAFFIVNIADTIFEVDHAFGSRGRDGKSPPLSKYPYKIVKEKDGLHYIFFGKYNAWRNSSSDDINVWRYPNNKFDTSKMDLSSGLTEAFAYANFYKSYKLNKDTTIYLNGIRFKCCVYREQVPSSSGAIIYERYLDKKTSMPIVINKLFYENGSVNSNFISQKYVLRFWLNKSDVKSIEFRQHNLTLSTTK